jgi:hypothetical protein
MKRKRKGKYVCVIAVGTVAGLWDIIQRKWVSITGRVKRVPSRAGQHCHLWTDYESSSIEVKATGT